MAQTVSDIARALNRRNAKGRKFPALILMTDAKRLSDPSPLIPKLPTGSAVIIRHFNRSSKIELINKIKLISAKHKVKLLVSDAPDLALTYQLDGIHFSEKQLKKIAACGMFKRPKPNFLLTCACHSRQTALKAKAVGVDAVLASPIFPTDSHPNTRTLGTWGLLNLSQNLSLKVYGLGGINTKTARRLSATPLCGLAGIGNLYDPGKRKGRSQKGTPKSLDCKSSSKSKD